MPTKNGKKAVGLPKLTDWSWIRVIEQSLDKRKWCNNHENYFEYKNYVN